MADFVDEIHRRCGYDLGRLTADDVGDLVNEDGLRVVVLLPVGSLEPHGPHLGLYTDTLISQSVSEWAAAALYQEDILAFVAPAIPYGVTECAGRIFGAVSVDAEPLTAFVRAVVAGYLKNGFHHVCLVNNHLEPAHDVAIRAAAAGFRDGETSVACPLTKRWGRTLSDEFKSGACHAGQYETSLILAADPSYVREDIAGTLPEVPISLSEKLGQGITDFVEMGLDRGYAGSPAGASRTEGDELVAKLGAMVVGEVSEAVAKLPKTGF
jgi:creatinine amidohydrolase